MIWAGNDREEDRLALSYNRSLQFDHMNKKLFVGNLSYNCTEDMLRDTFSEVGTVESTAIITDKMSGRSKGFGFVEMSTDEEAQKAIDEINGKEVDGRALTVNEAKPLEPRN